MIIGLDSHTLTAAFGWISNGLAVYFLYSRKRSKLKNPGGILPKATDFK
jgi:APA family basic amino acid/polyamine antiporter